MIMCSYLVYIIIIRVSCAVYLATEMTKTACGKITFCSEQLQIFQVVIPMCFTMSNEIILLLLAFPLK